MNLENKDPFIHQIFTLLFLENLRNQKIILKLTDLQWGQATFNGKLHMYLQDYPQKLFEPIYTFIYARSWIRYTHFCFAKLHTFVTFFKNGDSQFFVKRENSDQQITLGSILVLFQQDLMSIKKPSQISLPSSAQLICKFEIRSSYLI